MDDVTAIIDPLNEAQREAVTAPAGPALVLAGAGSGKTRVLVHRIAWLMQVEGVSPFGIMAVTFTNKAAAEMRGRIEQLLGAPAGTMWVGTFHGLAHRLLRLHWREAGLREGFQILDADDQHRMIKRLMRAMEIDDGRWPPKQIQWFINARKDEGLRARHVPDNDDPIKRQFVRVYHAYEEACERAGVVDFPELLLRAHELLRDNAEILRHYQRRFRHVLVDEFQDTNAIQYAWIRLLCGGEGQPFTVGDDDQSIYGWRGAKVENLQTFREDFAEVKVVRLEQNYRSTGTILRAANALIQHNHDRLGKNLWTDGEDGEPVTLYAAYNERDEAQYVIESLRQYLRDGGARSDAAILYRSNAQSRIFEELLMGEGIPYRVYGGLRFFERQEIKDALAYLRLVANRDDDPSMERVANVPTRGIGQRTMEQLRAHAREQGSSLWTGARHLIQSGHISARAGGALQKFLDLVDRLAADTAGLDLHEQVDHVIQMSGLYDHYGREKGEKKADARLENLDELVSAARGYEPDPLEEELPPLAAFLSHAALESGEGQSDAWEDCVQLMTLHSAKGLEFPLVFLTGMEDGLFPHQRSIEDPEGIQEERRLCYVGMTRAMKHLYLSYAESRRLHGNQTYGVPSRFLVEIPQDCLHEVRPRVQVSHPASGLGFSDPAPANDGITLGARVRHPAFGEGVVLHREGDGPQARVQINFEGVGSKWLVLGYANLEAV
ncbi:DNA helicase-2/ATP-dependent DNA helicase PcrA [Natronospira proteinivora]|uniref:DNA 3'-5' helicase n=1 Tax=Natronospira proteinivora TaxID=1807133 RepID=A0ABT1GAC4_9GAMM|nr:DNA helicase II [Natronospira proteinivora]MCP1728271.1 DNA helicase-2/ATP-dependent DNA helicase PcrA [Natronospira proteinivora]